MGSRLQVKVTMVKVGIRKALSGIIDRYALSVTREIGEIHVGISDDDRDSVVEDLEIVSRTETTSDGQPNSFLITDGEGPGREGVASGVGE